MAKKNSGKKKIRALFARSKIWSFFVNVAAYIYGKAEISLIGRLLSSYDEELFEKGSVHTLAKKADLGRRLFRPVKRTVSRWFSQSLLLNGISGFLSGFLNTKLNVYGLFFITSGIGFLLIELLKGYALNSSDLSFLDMFVSVTAVLGAIPMLFSSATPAEAVCTSKIASSVLFDWLGCKRDAFEKHTAGGGHTKTALVAGILLFIVSWWIRPVELYLCIVVLLFALAVINTPESGIVGLIVLIPFLDSSRLKLLISFVMICFLLKYIRGKRTVKIDPLAAVVLIFGLMCWISTSASDLSGRSGEMLQVIFSGIAVFFLVTNLIKSKVWINRCIRSVCVACFAVVSYGGIRYVSGRLGFDYLTELVGAAANEPMVSLFGDGSILCGYLLTVLPFMLFGMKSIKKERRTASGLFFAAGIACIVLTYELKAWLSFIIGIVLFMVIYSRRTFAFTMFSVCTLPIALLYIPRWVLSAVGAVLGESTRIADEVGVTLSGASQSIIALFYGRGLGGFESMYADGGYGMGSRLFIEIGLIGIIAFIGVLFLCLQKNTTLCSRGCSKHGRLVALLSMMGMFSLLVYSTMTNVFFDYKINLMFWLCLGISAAVSGTERKHIADEEYEVNEMEGLL